MNEHPLIHQMHEELAASGSDSAEDRPKLHLDGKRVDLEASDGPLKGTAARLCSVNDKTFTAIAPRLNVEHLLISEMRGADLSPLQSCARLSNLSVVWATKLADLSPLTAFPNLRFLDISDTPKVLDISPIAALKQLRVLFYQGGMWNKNTAETLEPLTELPDLRVLHLTNLVVKEGGLRALARLSTLEALWLSNQFETADYAYLAAHLPKVTCPQLAAYQTMATDIGGKDILVTGKRKPFLNSRDPKDQKRLERYVAEFETLKQEFLG